MDLARVTRVAKVSHRKIIEDFSLFIKQCYYIVLSVEKIVGRTKNGRIMLLSKYTACDSKKSKFIKQQEAGGLLSSLRIKKPLSKIPLVGSPLF